MIRADIFHCEFSGMSGKYNAIAVVINHHIASSGTQSSAYACLTVSGTNKLEEEERGTTSGIAFLISSA